MEGAYDVKIARSVVLILGNGFDLDLGLRTSYKDFYESRYCPKTYPAPLIMHLNTRWPDGLDKVKWYDLENELLNYFLKIKEEYPRVNDVITSKEAEFLNKVSLDNLRRDRYANYDAEIESLMKKNLLSISDLTTYANIEIPNLDDLKQSSIWRDQKALSLIKEGLSRHLAEIEQESIRDGSLAFAILGVLMNLTGLSVYNFNYTELPYMSDGQDEKIYYVHGKLDEENIIIGTKDDERYNDQYDFLQKSFAPSFNPPSVVYSLLASNEIVIFGHSLGRNDSQYFKAFFKEQTSLTNTRKKTITIFTKDEKSEIDIKRSLQEMTDYNLSSLYGMNEINIIKSSALVHDRKPLVKFLKRFVDDAEISRIIYRLKFRV